MKTCANCAASNLDAADFCIDCGAALPPTSKRNPVPFVDALPRHEANRSGENHDPTVRSGKAAERRIIPGRRKVKLPPTMAADVARPSAPKRVEINADYVSNRLTRRLAEFKVLEKKHRADIMFILDCTQSMKGELDAIRDAIISFVDTIRSEGVRVRIGLVEFRDRLIDEEHRVILFDGEPFTSDPVLFKREVMKLSATGGGDIPESSLDAVLLALRQPFDEDAQKVLVLITDAPPHIPDREARSVDEVMQQIKASSVSQFYLIIPVQEAENQVYLRLCQGTRSMAFDLGKGDDFNNRAEDFKRTLMALGKTISAATR